MPHAITASSGARSTAAAATGAAAGAAGASGASGASTPTSATNPAPGGPMGKDQFLKLLVAQMKNQDPLNPMDGTQMASQLAQFSTVEQLESANSTLTDIAAAVRAAKGGATSATGVANGGAGASATTGA